MGKERVVNVNLQMGLEPHQLDTNMVSLNKLLVMGSRGCSVLTEEVPFELRSKRCLEMNPEKLRES